MVDRRDGWVTSSTSPASQPSSAPSPGPGPDARRDGRRSGARFELPRLRVVPVIIAVNVVVFLMWQATRADTGLARLMQLNFLVSPAHLAAGRPWTLLTSAFSHEAFWHIAINMLVLFSFGRLLERLLRPGTFLAFYLAAGVVGSASHCLVSHLLMHDDTIAALGASGATCGLLMAFSLLFPREKILVLGIIPVPAIFGALGFAAFDLWGVVAQATGGGLSFAGGIRIGHGAHLGGMLAGTAFHLLYARPRARQLLARLAGPGLSLDPADAAELQRLHHKVREQGRDQLTPKEQQFLLDLRRRLEHDQD